MLADHKKVGKKFIPPFVAKLGPLDEVRWVNDLVCRASIPDPASQEPETPAAS